MAAYLSPPPQPTVTAAEDFDPEVAARKFMKAFKGIGSDERMIIELLTKHSSLQRQEIEEKYKTMFGKVGLEGARPCSERWILKVQDHVRKGGS